MGHGSGRPRRILEEDNGQSPWAPLGDSQSTHFYSPPHRVGRALACAMQRKECERGGASGAGGVHIGEPPWW